MSTDTLLALICPEFSLEDYERIQHWRRAHDAVQADQVLPHFTLVFPVSGWSPGAFAREVEARLAGHEPFEIVLSQAVSHQDSGSADAMVWLVPSIGREALSGLQDRLYAGTLSAERPADEEGIPHITIGRGLEAAASQALVKRINAAGLEMRCTASAVQIVRLKGERVRTVERIPLGRSR
tara:strand:- start:27169 stop:27711 length:543 start_codon:yes stop_codon:yes gene_type:complete